MSALASQSILENPTRAFASEKKTRILIVADNPVASRPVATSLRTLGFDVLLCLFDGRTLSSTPVKAPDAILCHLTDYVEAGSRIAKVVRKHFAPRQLPVIGALSRPAPDVTQDFESVLFAPMHASQIAHRVKSMIRLGRMEAEITRRLATLRDDFDENIKLGDMSPDRRFRILFIGKASPAFMIVINALQDKGADVVAAFTSFSAFDYLHDGPFDAVVMNALEQSEPALSILETMRRNSRLYHVPTLFLIEDDFRDAELAYQRGAQDLIDINAEPEEISGRILELANYHRIHEQMKAEIFSIIPQNCRDKSGTVFSPEFFERHFDRFVTDAQSSGENVSLLALKIVPDGACDLSVADRNHLQRQATEMIVNLVRMQDVVCREDDIFCLAFYGTDETETVIIRNRLQKLIEDSAFRAMSDASALVTLSCETAIHQLGSEERPERALKILMNELETASV